MEPGTTSRGSNMRHQGTIVSWDAGRGIGAIQWHGGEAHVFVRITDFPPGLRRPEVGDVITYYRGADNRGRPIASMVEYVHAAGHTPPSLIGHAPIEHAPIEHAPIARDRPGHAAGHTLPPSFARGLPQPPARRPVVPALLTLALIMVAAWAAWNWL